MLQVNPMQLIQQIKNGQNPQQLMLSILENQMQDTPMGANLLNLARNNQTAEIEKIARNIFDEIICDDIYESLRSNNLNKALIKNLEEEESVRFCKVLNYQVGNSSFKPQKDLLEVRFDDNKKIKSLKIKIKNIRYKINIHL